MQKKKSKWSKKYNISEVARHETTEVNCFKETSLQTHHTTRHKNRPSLWWTSTYLQIIYLQLNTRCMLYTLCLDLMHVLNITTHFM